MADRKRKTAVVLQAPINGEEPKVATPLEKENKVIKPKKKSKARVKVSRGVKPKETILQAPVCEEIRQYPVTTDEAIDMITAIVSACIQTGDKEVPKSIIKKFSPDADAESRFNFIFNSIEDQLTVSYHKDIAYYSYNKFKHVCLNGLVTGGLSLGEAFSKSNK